MLLFEGVSTSLLGANLSILKFEWNFVCFDCLIVFHFLYTVFLLEKSRLASSSEQACNISSDSELRVNRF